MSANKSVRPATAFEREQLYAAFAGLEDAAGVAALLEDMCTIREMEEMSQRLEVARLLSIREPYTIITEKTGASATTIARVAKALNYGAGGYARVLGVSVSGVGVLGAGVSDSGVPGVSVSDSGVSGAGIPGLSVPDCSDCRS